MSTQDPSLPASFAFKQYQQASDKAVSAGKLGGLAADKPLPIKTGGWNDTRNDVNADGKYLLLAVPEWKPGMSSYLRLGAACSTWDTALGNELEKAIHLTGPLGKATNLPFIDDERLRGGHPVNPGVGATLSESEILHTKGGWRDHSDGNRITTTYGDKIEIIRGNYKMLVLGRQDVPKESCGWDLSGQIMQDWGYSMPGASVTLEWVPLYGGTWLRKDSLEIFHQWNRVAGISKSEYWGDLLETYIGQETPGVSMPQDPAWTGTAMNPCLKINPVIIEKTFAISITSQTGSQVLPVPTIADTTFVTTSTSSTTADSITDTTTVTGAITDTTTAGSITSTTTVSGDVDDTTTVGGSVTETTNVSGSVTTDTDVDGTLSDSTTASAITEITTAGAIVDITTSGTIDDSTSAAVQGAVFIGGINASLYAAALQMSLNAGLGLEFDLTKRFTLALAVELRLYGLSCSIDNLRTVAVASTYTIIAGAYFVSSPLIRTPSYAVTYIGA